MQKSLATCTWQYPMAPSTTRGLPLHLSADANRKSFVYGSQEAAVLRSADLREFKVFESHAKKVTTVQCAPTGDRVFSADETGHAYVWHASHAELLSPWDFQAATGAILDAGFTAEGDKLAFVGDLVGGKIGKTASVNLKKTDQDLSGHSLRALSCSFKVSRPFKLYTAGEDGCVNVYGSPGFTLNKTVNQHKGFVNCVRVSPDGKLWVSCSADKSVAIYSTETDELVKLVENAHGGSVYSACWFEDSQRFATCGADKTVKLWTDKGELVSSLSVSQQPTADDMQLGVARIQGGLVSVSLSGALNFWRDESLAMATSPDLVVYGHNVAHRYAATGGSARHTRIQVGQRRQGRPRA